MGAGGHSKNALQRGLKGVFGNSLVELMRVELTTSAVRLQRSPN